MAFNLAIDEPENTAASSRTSSEHFERRSSVGQRVKWLTVWLPNWLTDSIPFHSILFHSFRFDLICCSCPWNISLWICKIFLSLSKVIAKRWREKRETQRERRKDEQMWMKWAMIWNGSFFLTSLNWFTCEIWIQLPFLHFSLWVEFYIDRWAVAIALASFCQHLIPRYQTNVELTTQQ